MSAHIGLDEADRLLAEGDLRTALQLTFLSAVAFATGSDNTGDVVANRRLWKALTLAAEVVGYDIDVPEEYRELAP